MAKKEIVIQTRLGEREVDSERMVTFPKGIIGFESMRDFVLLQIKDDSPFMLLQSTEDPNLGLIVTDPYSFLDDYEIHVGEAEQKILQIQDIKDVAILVTVTIPQGRPNDTTLNLTGPILINSTSKVGMQVPQTDPKYPGHYRLESQEFG